MNKKSLMKKLLLFVIILFFVLAPLYAQTSNSDKDLSEQEKLIEDETLQELEKLIAALPSPIKKLSIQFGAWLSSIFRDYQDADNDKDSDDSVSRMWHHEIRLWTQMTFFKRHNLYLRIKNTYLDRKASSVNYTGIGSDYEGPALDVGYLEANFSPRNMPLKLTLGRQYIYLGRGIAYRDVHDGLKATFQTENFFYKGFITHTLPDEDNIDTSKSDYDKKGQRMFYGFELGYLGLPNSVLYAYYLFQDDLSTSRFPDVAGDAQTYLYYSKYFGFGFEGKLKNLEYETELIREIGLSYTDTASSLGLNDARDISAWAFDLNLRYKFDVLTHPLLEFEYAFGSGDQDRSSVTDTKSGGNVYGDDKNFLYFGSFYGGYALSPRLSNINIYKLHIAFSPLEKIKFGKNIVCGFKFYFYKKDRAEGGIYDTQATSSYKHIGHEIDGYIYWKVNSRLSWSFRYGIFYPGKAYPKDTNSNTKYLYTRLTYSF